MVDAGQARGGADADAFMVPMETRNDFRFGSRSYGDGGKGLAPLSLCENRWRCPHDPS
jgi:hypothetical protein